jgi:hypothetical protein
MDQACPICGAAVSANPRYPKYLCADCVQRASDENGKRLSFSQSSRDGRYAARYLVSGEPYSSHECFVDERKCWADEARFGGIVVQLI